MTCEASEVDGMMGMYARLLQAGSGPRGRAHRFAPAILRARVRELWRDVGAVRLRNCGQGQTVPPRDALQ